jgi:hypothetical protein
MIMPVAAAAAAARNLPVAPGRLDRVTLKASGVIMIVRSIMMMADNLIGKSAPAGLVACTHLALSAGARVPAGACCH